MGANPIVSTPFRADKPIFTSAAAYAAGDSIGSLLTLDAPSPFLSGPSGPILIVQSLTVVDLDDQKSPLDIVLFSSAPTDPGDNNPFAPTDADALKVVGRLSVSSGDYQTYGTKAVATMPALGLSAPIVGKELFALVIAQGGPTYTGTDRLRTKLTGILT